MRGMIVHERAPQTGWTISAPCCPITFRFNLSRARPTRFRRQIVSLCAEPIFFSIPVERPGTKTGWPRVRSMTCFQFPRPPNWKRQSQHSSRGASLLGASACIHSRRHMMTL